jgi:drug/metabolite transporter (DMT)-like permease
MQKNNILKSHLHLHLIVFIWGFTSILGALISLEALSLVWYRMLFASIFILLYALFKKIPLQFPIKTVALLFFAGFVIALHWLTFFQAIKVSNISITLACFSTSAFFASILEPIFYKRKVIAYEVIFGLIVVVGLYIIFKVEKGYSYGIILGLLSAFLSATFSIINGKFAQKYNPVAISLYEIFGGVIFLSLFLLYNNSFSLSFFKLSLNDLFWLFILSSVCTAYAFIASVKIMKFLSSYTVMLTINLEPVYGIILALIVFNEKEKMSGSFYVGVIIILITIILNGIIKNKTRKMES